MTIVKDKIYLTLQPPLMIFELDQVNTLNAKVETFKKAGIKHGWITYMPVDYSNESWVELFILLTIHV